MPRASSASIPPFRCTNWWNTDPNINYLTKDLATLRQLKFLDEDRFRALLCAGDCVVAAAAKQDIAPILKNAGFLLDDKATLPQSGMILSTMLQAAFSTSTIKKSDARNQWEKQILDAAAAQKDADFFNIAANFNLGSPKLADIDRLCLANHRRFTLRVIAAHRQAGQSNPHAHRSRPAGRRQTISR